jgi:hypothetical protein
VGKIASEDAAKRLANAIMHDIRLYNADKLNAGGDLSVEFAEGRALFEDRVDSAYRHVFDESARTNGFGPFLAGSGASPDLGASPPPLLHGENRSASEQGGGKLVLVGLLLLLAVGAWLFLRR